MNRDRLLILIAASSLLAVIFAIVLFWVMADPNGTANVSSGNRQAAVSATPDTSPAAGNPILSILFGEGRTQTATLRDEAWGEYVLSIIFRLTLAVLLAGILAFRPQRSVGFFKRRVFVSQTQILIAVVAAALMMIVGDNAARAFAIFAAAALVRFRTNIRDPKEITVLLISLALGLSAGVGHWELGLVLCFFSLGLLWLLEYNETAQLFRTMELSIKTKDIDQTKRVLKKLFRRYDIDSEVRELDPPEKKDKAGEIVYFLNLPLSLTTDYMSARIIRIEGENIESIQWSQKKEASKIYK